MPSPPPRRIANPSDWLAMDAISEQWLDRYHNSFPAPTPGQLIYERWCGSYRTERARYWLAMHPAEKRMWESLGEELRERLSEDDWGALIHNIKEYR